MGLMADAWDGPSSTQYKGVGTSERAGFGRISMLVPDDDSYGTDNWLFSVGTASINHGNTLYINVNGGSHIYGGSVNEFHIVGLWYENDLLDAADITLEVFNTCPASGPDVQLGYDSSYSLTKQVKLDVGDDVCLQAKVKAWYVPSSGSREFFYAYRYREYE